ncbi:hypothetical protein [Methanobrevibacter sp. UBA188]|jgi:hypothetical protein|uniref:hypothetical protein n=1 Tax=Methanobrevibacter sp. UBA188 TaxID=1915473 RepID=UPI0025DF242F|nr:hypothetical protein [Methanobrevibacter sp. UBA188]
MKFHEDVIFKNEGQIYGQKLMEIINIKGKIIEVHQTEYSVIDPKMYKPDLVFELEDKIVILEFQSTYVNINDKRRFRFYTALIDHVKIKSEKPIEVHVLSTIEAEKTKCYKVNSESRFPIYIHSLKKYDGNEFLNIMNTKIESNKNFSEKELLMISLLCFMKTDEDIEQAILNSALIITNIKDLKEDIGQFAKGVILMLCDKFVTNESMNRTISNLVGGNMKIVEDYAQRVAQQKVDEKLEEKNKKVIINLNKKGFEAEEIAETVDVSIDFVNKVLAK